MGLALLADFVTRLNYANFLETWTPGTRYSGSQPLGLFALLGVPAGIILLWTMWKPSPERQAALGTTRRWCGNIVLAATALLWFRYIYYGICDGWTAATPVDDPLAWLRQSHKMFNHAQMVLPIGGLIALWLKGIRMPPRSSREVK